MFRAVVTSGGLSSLVILGLILIFLLFNGFNTLKTQGLHFLTSSTWQAAVNDSGQVDPKNSHFGIAAMLIGTMVVAVIAVVVGVPISVGSAIYCGAGVGDHDYSYRHFNLSRNFLSNSA